jgi:hypothetical protein
VQGVATFPSFHAAGAIVYISAARGIRFLFPFFIVINILMLISTNADRRTSSRRYVKRYCPGFDNHRNRENSHVAQWQRYTGQGAASRSFD